MKYKKVIVGDIMKKQLLLLLLMLFSITTSSANSDPLVVVDFKLDKTQYLSGQTIWTETHVKNISHDTLLVAYDQSKHYLLFDSCGNQAIQPPYEQGKPTIARIVLPDSIIVIGPALGLSGQHFDSTHYSVGHYILWCSLDIYSPSDAGRIHGEAVRAYATINEGFAKPVETIVGNISLDIIEGNDEEKTVLSEMQLYHQKRKKDYYADVRGDINKILIKYPKSAYAPQCMDDYLTACHILKDDKGKVEAVKQFFDNYSDSKYLYSISMLLLDHYNNLNYLQVKQELNKWKEQYKTNDNVVKVIDKLLAKIKGNWRYN